MVETYPPETSKFLKDEKDRFLNPVGHTISHEMENILEELLGTMDIDKLQIALDHIIKIRAVQEFSPSEAISFVFLLKNAIKDELGIKDTKSVTMNDGQRIHSFLQLEEKIDRIASIAFDIYTQCKQKIYEIKLREAKSRSRNR